MPGLHKQTSARRNLVRNLTPFQAEPKLDHDAPLSLSFPAKVRKPPLLFRQTADSSFSPYVGHWDPSPPPKSRGAWPLSEDYRAFSTRPPASTSGPSSPDSDSVKFLPGGGVGIYPGIGKGTGQNG